MNDLSASDSSARRARLMAIAGWLIIALSAGSALLPLLDRAASATLVGSLLLAAGIVEILAATQRNETKLLAMLAGAVTTFAGLMFLANPVAKFFPLITIVTAWLLVRSVILFLTSRIAHGAVRTWIGLSAVTDAVLGVLLLAGLSIATLVVTIFGPTPTLVASFAWVFALSFVVTGMLLLEVASCERDSAD
ncbi:DUF308 domain-containing protein [Sphingomonas sp.]|uniref:DUF308 domain-containing protein n=1 Tax=Sphingomonas sp. TaxID=28214 RepID=UPI00286D8F94|nr:DUF308 domain-containing protein [Sphingomonas sp.]